jgi:hypothetical protein
MVYQSIKWTIISLLIILLTHYLYAFLQNTLTVPKARYINNNTNKYKKSNNHGKERIDKERIGKERIIKKTNDCDDSMKNELNDYLLKIKKKIKKNNKGSNTKTNEPDTDTEPDLNNTSELDTHNNDSDNESLDNDDIDDIDSQENANTETVVANDIGFDTYTTY